jgi:hypothetical protein
MATAVPVFKDISSYYVWANAQAPNLAALRRYVPDVTDAELTSFQLQAGFIQAGVAAQATGTAGVSLRTVMILRGIVQVARVAATLASDLKAVANFQALEERMNYHLASLSNSRSVALDITRMQVRERRLEALTYQLGGLSKLVSLPASTLAAAFNHPDDVIAVTADRPAFEIGDLDLTAGYTVFDAEHDVLYALTGLAVAEWGRAPEDVAWTMLTTPGDYGYLMYVPMGARPRVIQLVRG